MILLSFASAAKLILGLMLAMLGIIPFEEVQPPDPDTPVVSTMPAMQGEKPLQYIPAGIYAGQDPVAFDAQTSEQPKFIALRDDHSVAFQFPEKSMVWTVEYKSLIEGLSQDTALQKILILCSQEASEIWREEFVIIESGI